MAEMEHETKTDVNPPIYASAPSGGANPPPYASIQNPPTSGMPYAPYPQPQSGAPYPPSQGGYEFSGVAQPGYGYPQYGAATSQQMIVTSGQPVVIVQHDYVSMIGAIVLSCFVFWCCGIMCGGIAFILAMVGQSASSAGNAKSALQLRNASYGVSAAGIVVGIIFIVLMFIFSGRH